MKKEELGPITVTKIKNHIYQAQAHVEMSGCKTEINMYGATEDAAREKLTLSWEGKNYKHLDPPNWDKLKRRP